jgi:hypothetical protein
MRVNEVRHRESARDILIEDLIDHYIHTELSEDAAYHPSRRELFIEPISTNGFGSTGRRPAFIRLEQSMLSDG